MFRPLELFVGLRYTRAKRRNHFISFISLISMVGIALGVTALITVLSVMNGFEQELRNRILGMTSHVTIGGYGDPVQDWPELVRLTSSHPEVLGAAPYIQAEGMLTYGSRVRGTLVRGILPGEEPKVSEVGDNMVAGRLDDLRAGEFGIVLGRDSARLLNVTVGDKVTLVTPSANVSPAGILPRLKRFTVVGVFEVGMYEYDSALALLHLQDAQRLFRMDEGVSGVRLKLDDLFRAPFVARELAQTLPGLYQVSDWTWQHANFFRAIRTEKTVMFVILFLIVAVAAFNIVSTLVMVVTDKQSDIAILRTLGGEPAQHHDGVHGAGHHHRHHRYAARPGRRREPGAQRGDHRAGAGAAVRYPVPAGGRLLHQRPAFGTALGGCGAHLRRGLPAQPGGDAVSGLARLAHPTGGGAAL